MNADWNARAGHNRLPRLLYMGSLVTAGAVVVLVLLFFTGRLHLLTPDQRGYRLFQKERYADAAQNFTDPLRQGVAFFRAGEFTKAAGIFSGFDTAEAAYNHGNSLVMLGRYAEAIPRYERALSLAPGNQAAAINLEIARHRAQLLKKKGGDMTGGKMGADAFVFDKKSSSAKEQEEQLAGGEKLSDSAMRAVWLRNVQSKPADFLKFKFAYQLSAPKMEKEPPAPTE